MSIVDIGIGLAFAAMLCWGLGDFLIQKSCRACGDWEALFVVALLGALIVSPFAIPKLPAFWQAGGTALIILGVACIILFFAAILDFEALRVGKLAVVEPIWSIEIPASALLAFFILGERISWSQIVIIAFLIIGLFLVSVKEKQKIKRFFVERGVLLALLAGTLMGAANFFVGWGSRVSNPLVVNFVTDLFLILVTGAYLFFTGRIGRMVRDFRSHVSVLLPTGILDKAAWVAFAFSMTLAPIAVAVALSESYIIVAVILGLAINKEKLEGHQKFGLGLAVVSAIVLAVTIT
jgi:drug/metabolite transporter (DMT)-like permease